MTSRYRTTSQTLKKLFLGLPRELRDLIYAEVFSDSAPIPLEDIQIGPAGLTLLTGEEMDGNLESEIEKAFYTNNTFRILFSRTQPVDLTRPIGSMFPRYQKHIRKLVVHAEEAILMSTTSLEDLEMRYRGEWHQMRARWEVLLQLPQLEQLTIRLQKQTNNHFSWADFSPVLIQLRKRLPKLRTAFTISFDTLLERYWSDPVWENYTEPGNVVEEPYEPMGFVNVTDLIEPPTKEDIAYVRENLPHDKETHGRDILRGLLDETASQRRALAMHYVVKEPALLRVRIMEHYEVYERMKNKELENVNSDPAIDSGHH